MQKLSSRLAGLWLAFVALVLGTFAASAQPTDITGVITAVDTYRTAAIVVAIAILLFVIGRRVVGKLVK